MNGGENLYKTQRDMSVVDKMLKDCTPEQLEMMKRRLNRTNTDEKMNKALGELIDFEDWLSEEGDDGDLSFSGLATGFPTLDNEYLFGLRPGDVVVLAAYTSIGKSMFCIDWCMEFAKQGKNSVVFCLEDNKREVKGKIKSLAKGRGITSMKDYKGRALIFPMEYKNLFFKNKFAIIPAIEALVGLNDLSVVCVDMLNDMVDPINDKDAEDFMVALKEMCDNLGIVMIVTSRLREPKGLTAKAQWWETYAPNEDAIYGKGMIKYLATKIITLAESASHPYKPQTAFSGAESRFVSISVCKNRVGKTTSKEGMVITCEMQRGVLGTKLIEHGKEELNNAA